MIRRNGVAGFPRQFLGRLTEGGAAGRLLDRLELDVPEDLTVCDLENRDGEAFGHLLGIAVHEGKLLEDRATVDPDGLLAWRRELAGRFIIVAEIDGDLGVYPDASASMGVVFSKSLSEFASTTEIFSPEAYGKVVSPLVNVLDIPQRGSWYPFGLTRGSNLERLLPHHVLSLTKRTQKRVRLPGSENLTRRREARDPREVVEQLFSRLAVIIAALAGGDKCAMALTAGRDSRMLLAAVAASGRQDDITYFTNQIPDGAAAIDIIVARRLAAALGVGHRIVPYLKPTKEDLEEWQRLVGWSAAGRTWKMTTSKKKVFSDHVIISGLCGEVGRAFYWRPPDLSGQRLDPAEFVDRLNLPRTPLLEEAAERWLADFASSDWLDTLDFAYIELRLGCWSAPSLYGDANRKSTVSPYNCEALFDLMLELPQQYRFEQKLYGDLIRLGPRVFRSIPINTATRLQKLGYVLRHPVSGLRIMTGRGP